MTDATGVDVARSFAPSGVIVLTALLAILAVALVGQAAASAPPLSCAAGDPGVHYTAPSNLTVADASDATVDSPFAGNDSIAVGDLTVSADGTAFARVETATGEACLSDLDATTVPVTVETDAASVTVEGSVDALAFDDPSADDEAFAYRASDGATLTLADAGHPSGTVLRVLDAGTDRELGIAEVSSDGSLSLSLPASEDGTRVRLATQDGGTTTPGQTQTETPTVTPTATDTPEDGGAPGVDTDDGEGNDGGVPWPLLVLIALLAIVGAVAALRRRD